MINECPLLPATPAGGGICLSASSSPVPPVSVIGHQHQHHHHHQATHHAFLSGVSTDYLSNGNHHPQHHFHHPSMGYSGSHHHSLNDNSSFNYAHQQQQSPYQQQQQLHSPPVTMTTAATSGAVIIEQPSYYYASDGHHAFYDHQHASDLPFGGAHKFEHHQGQLHNHQLQHAPSMSSNGTYMTDSSAPSTPNSLSSSSNHSPPNFAQSVSVQSQSGISSALPDHQEHQMLVSSSNNLGDLHHHQQQQQHYLETHPPTSTTITVSPVVSVATAAVASAPNEMTDFHDVSRLLFIWTSPSFSIEWCSLTLLHSLPSLFSGDFETSSSSFSELKLCLYQLSSIRQRLCVFARLLGRLCLFRLMQYWLELCSKCESLLSSQHTLTSFGQCMPTPSHRRWLVERHCWDTSDTFAYISIHTHFHLHFHLNCCPESWNHLSLYLVLPSISFSMIFFFLCLLTAMFA